ncbi:KPN_02809 family neutral zinc metallopeptidase [Methylosinus sp. LW4]|uniref:KPN_02809 family neutral zinc metallopeptidase n=1 Tax=Methylosinus sp. LW4 TaxID=136993 RepID=UPI00037DAF1B|nr:neutral zinc metallopeptidase [Methylosinus sp. LW4]
MRWDQLGQSDNIEDRRSQDYADAGAGPSFGGGGGLGLGTIVILGVLAYAFGINPALLIGGAEVLSNMRGGGQVAQQRLDRPTRQAPTGAPADRQGQFISAVLAGNERVWSQILPEQKGIRFDPARLVLFNGVTGSACGRAQSAMGPFYCPIDRKIYLDTSFFRDMDRRFGGGGDFAYAYVISHEMGHHIENLLGILPKVQRAQQMASSRSESNNLSVRVELMADCLSGVWAAHADQNWKILEKGDIEKAINTAQAIGDDRLQRSAQGYAVPDSFTHGSSAQRVEWFQRGLQTGKIDACNTFTAQR